MLLGALLVLSLLGEARGQGYMIDPPARSSLWRVHKGAPINYNDMSVNCGGFETEYHHNGGKCGVCGDPFSQSQPRDNEAGGKYGRGIISKNYSPGQEITIGVQLTANHKGYFEFRLCKNDDVTKIVDQSCLDQNLLQLKNGSGTATRYYLPPDRLGRVEVTALLPAGLTCSQCVLQWKWREGNYVGLNADHVECAGCGPQVEFYGCSDISIGQGGPSQGSVGTNAPIPTTARVTYPPPIPTTARVTYPPPVTTRAPVYFPTSPPRNPITYTPFWLQTTRRQPSNPFSTCRGTHHDSGLEKLDQWCIDTCQRGDCPDFLCYCPDVFGTNAPVTSRPATPQPTTWRPTQQPSTWRPTQQPATWRPETTWRPFTPVPVTQQPVTQSPGYAGPTTSASGNLVNQGPTRMTGLGEFDGCRGTGLWGIGDINLDNWCVDNCSKGNCPSVMCKCP